MQMMCKSMYHFYLLNLFDTASNICHCISDCSETNIIVFGAQNKIQNVGSNHSLSLMTKSQVRQLGIILDFDLNFNSHIKSVTSSVYYHLKNTARVRGIMSKQNLVRLTHAFISSRLDYCNGLFTGLPEKLLCISNLFRRLLPGS